ncbi:hypothetical protein EJ04DRAFT_571824 [Polyplosphaeria fusca]|uniref:Uncharacterized protein n=1 Tax=Polyplosphaeria fusca TaxID=682080 RepID=A0A9P4RD17_9PLEO|nr:hypothetical protein EJ04DRAFT_571824 [Polyplosphaeria fusca]
MSLFPSLLPLSNSLFTIFFSPNHLGWSPLPISPPFSRSSFMKLHKPRPNLEMLPRKISTDIADRSYGPPSPAPTYHSTFHSTKDSSTSTTPNPSEPSPSPTSSSRNFSRKHNHQDSKHTPPLDTEKQSPPSPYFPITEEPHDPSHPHYVPPSSSHIPPSPSFLPPRRNRHPRLPRLSILLPWILFAIFFLLSAWYTSIALGVRLFHNLTPSQQSPPPINVIVNAPAAQVSTVPFDTPVPAPSSRGGVPGNGVDPNRGTNTEGVLGSAKSGVVTATTATTATATATAGPKSSTIVPVQGVGPGRRGVVGGGSTGFATVTVLGV